MMFDSYNTKYGLNDKEMNTGTLTADTERVKLFYQYPTTLPTIYGSNLGYAVGPSNENSAVNGYFWWTSPYTVKADLAIDSMYCPGINYYWLASPSAQNGDNVMYVTSNRTLNTTFYTTNSYDGYALCPLVSLQSSATLELQ